MLAPRLIVVPVRTWCVFTLLCTAVWGQQRLTLAQAVESALAHYPSVEISQAQVDAAGAGIRLARTAYLPKVDALAQVNRGTRNNIFGMLLPQSVLPNISGPPINSNNSSRSPMRRANKSRAGSICWPVCTSNTEIISPPLKKPCTASQKFLQKRLSPISPSIVSPI